MTVTFSGFMIYRSSARNSVRQKSQIWKQGSINICLWGASSVAAQSETNNPANGEKNPVLYLIYITENSKWMAPQAHKHTHRDPSARFDGRFHANDDPMINNLLMDDDVVEVDQPLSISWLSVW